jgi:hypothetical protein
VAGRDLLVGDVMLQPFDRNAEVQEVRIGTRYANLTVRTEGWIGRTRVGLDQEVAIKRAT